MAEPEQQLPVGILIKRKKRASVAQTPLRSHFSSPAHESSLDSTFSHSMTSQSVREQTLSWTFRELGHFEEQRQDKDKDKDYHQPISAESCGIGRESELCGGPLTAIHLAPPDIDSPLTQYDQVDAYIEHRQELEPLLYPVREEGIEIFNRIDQIGDASSATATIDGNGSPSNYGRYAIDIVGLLLYSTPAVCLAVMLTLLDAMSFGIIIFPHSDPHIPETGPQAGISMFLASSIISQIVYTSGGSKFKGAVGSMMVEVMPFLHIICAIIEEKMIGSTRSAIIATIMVGYASSTILTGIVFMILGVFKLGNVIQFFPRHILVGCIGGIGLFLLFTAIEVTSHVSPIINFQYFVEIFKLNHFVLWFSSLVVAIFLKFLQNFISHQMLMPIFYASIPVFFYVIVFALGIPLDVLREAGWLFKFEGQTDVPFYIFWTYFDFAQVNWSAVAATIPTQLALTFFGILHVPINVPALSVSTRQDVDLSQEIIGHGISNILSGLLGCTQNYMVYSNSLLYIRCGGNSTTSSVLLTIVTIALWTKGSFLIDYVPTIVVGGLIFHLGIDLLKESVYDTLRVGMHRLEYLTILVIVGIMGLVGFTEGILVGVILACIFFVFMYSRKTVIRETFSGAQLRSTVHRLYRQQNFLDKVGNQIHIIKLQGYMFFGTVNQLDVYLKEILENQPQIKFFVLDFTLISGVDYSGLETFLRIKRKLAKGKIHLVFCGLYVLEHEIRLSGIFDDLDDGVEESDSSNLVHSFNSLNDALEWAENYLLATYYVKLKTTGPKSIPTTNKAGAPRLSLLIPGTPRSEMIHQAADIIMQDHPIIQPSKSYLPFRFLMQAVSDTEVIDEELLHVFAPYFSHLEFKAQDLLYAAGSEAAGLYIVELGQLGLSIVSGDLDKMIVVETLLLGTMVGELELFASRPRICNLICLSDATVWFLPKSAYEELSVSHPHLMLKFITKISSPFEVTRLYNSLCHFSILR